MEKIRGEPEEKQVGQPEVPAVVWEMGGVGSGQCGVDQVERYDSRW